MTAICPYCFKTINLKKADLRCASKMCLEAGTTERHIIPRKLAKVDRNGYGTCEICSRSTHILVCSECGKDLPDTISESPTKIISIVGAKFSGKSYYVATLLRQLIDEGLLARINGSSVRIPSDSRIIYNDRYKSYLDNRLPLRGTNYFTNIVRDNPPVLVQITHINSHKKKIDNTYSFFDAAGESFDKTEDLAAITPYISHSEAIILILDPRQIKKVDDAVSAAIPNLPKVSTVKYEDTINAVSDVLFDSLRIRRRNKIGIPICVAFSKWDLLINTPNLLPSDFIVSKPTAFSAMGYSRTLLENSSAEIRSLLNEWDPNFLNTVESKFQNVCYAGFSAWGVGSKDGRDIPVISPFRVEDPMLWVMDLNGEL